MVANEVVHEGTDRSLSTPSFGMRGRQGMEWEKLKSGLDPFVSWPGISRYSFLVFSHSS